MFLFYSPNNNLGRSFQIASFAGIPVKLHWSIFLLPIFIIGLGFFTGANYEMILLVLGFILLTFICVIMHEYGHALSAKRYGIVTQDIIISIAGGIARLKRIPDEAFKEFNVAIAGPLVNLTIFSLLFVPLYFNGSITHPFDFAFYDIADRIDSFSSKELVPLIMYINGALFLFNLIPAFPMDGGRMLRSLLSQKLPKLQATYWAMMLSRVIALAMIIAGVWWQIYFFAFVGIFILSIGTSEYKMVWIEDLLNRHDVQDILRENIPRINAKLDLNGASKYSKEVGERDLLVYDDANQLLGVLCAEYLNDGLKSSQKDEAVSGFLRERFTAVSAQLSLKDLYDKINNEALCIAEVSDGTKVLGTVSRSGLNRFIREKYKERNLLKT